jgi:hypothetical protein
VAYHKTSPLPSVTQVLAPFVDYSRVPAHVLEAASERGSRVHAICAAKLLGVWHPPVTADVAGYVRSFEGWARVVSDVVLVEPELEDTALGYCGHLDLVCRIRGDKGATIVDLKTPATCMLSWRAQLAAYRNLAETNGHQISRVFSLRLDKAGGRAKVDEYTGTVRADFAGFLSALNAFRYFKGGK